MRLCVRLLIGGALDSTLVFFSSYFVLQGAEVDGVWGAGARGTAELIDGFIC